MDRHELKKSQKTAEQRLKAEYGFESDDGADEFSASDEDQDLIREFNHKKKFSQTSS